MDLESVKKSDYWKKKIRASILAQDVDGDGFITKKDLDMIIQRYKNAGSSPEHIKMLQDSYKKMYAVWGMTDNTKLTIDQYMEMYAEKFDDTFYAVSDEIIALWFQQVDANGDGIISVQEWTVHNSAISIDAETAKKSFEAMDANKDGKVSKEEFVDYHMEYFFSAEDKLKSSLLFQPFM